MIQKWRCLPPLSCPELLEPIFLRNGSPLPYSVVRVLTRYRPNAVSNLVDAIRLFGGQEGQPKPIELRRSLLILLNVVKEVATARVGPGRPKLKSYAEDLLILLSGIYSSSFRPDVIQAGLHSNDDLPILEIMLEQSLLSIKTIRRLAVGLLDKVRDNETVKQIWEASLQNFQAVLEIAITNQTTKGPENRALILLHRNLGQVAKMHVRMAKVCPTDFAMLQGDQFGVIRLHWQLMALLGQQYATSAGYPAISQVIYTVHDFDETRKSLLHKLGHQALLLLRACVSMVANPGRGLVYRTDEEKSADTTAMEQVKKVIFTNAAVVELVDHIVMELLLFQPTDLREWEEEPDEWEKREEASGEDYEFAARPCAEKLLVDLSIRMNHVAVGQILKLLATVSGLSSLGHVMCC
jgi:hypothetical protein